MFDKNLLKQLKKIRKIHNKRIKIENRIEENLKQVKLTQEETCILEEITKKFFPNHGSWTSNAYDKSEDSIYCHLRDNYWLAKKIKNNVSNIEYAKVLKFVSTSDFFKQERHDYEQRIVEWQINFMMKNKEGWIAEDFMEWMPDCDINFRKAIIDTLVAIGIDEEAIEEGIEKNANIWRNHYINQAFENEYNNFLWNSNFLGSNKGIEIPKPLDIHKEKWIKLRKYEYYQRHISSVTNYGNSSDLVDMSMTLNKIEELKLELESLNNERLKEISFYKQQRENIEFESYKRKMITKGV